MPIKTYPRYWDNGNLRSENPYQNKKLHGVCKGWWRDGRQNYEITYQNGKRHGITRWWHGDHVYKHYYLYSERVAEKEWRKHELIEELSCL